MYVSYIKFGKVFLKSDTRSRCVCTLCKKTEVLQLANRKGLLKKLLKFIEKELI